MTSTFSDVIARPLDGWIIGVSVSGADDLAVHGYTSGDVNRVTVRLSGALLAAGARLVFGHDWRPDGVMEAICRFAVAYQAPGIQSSARPLVQNLVAWPNETSLTPEQRHDLEQRGIVKVETVGLPAFASSSPTDPAARAIALTHMRRELAKRTNARVCLGGKEDNVEGFFAGIIEEAYNAAVGEQPLFIARFLGGAAAKLATAIQQGIFNNVPALRVLTGKTKPYQDVQGSASELVPPEDLSSAFDPAKLQQRSGLDPKDWQRLLDAADVEAFSTLVIRGLHQLNK